MGGRWRGSAWMALALCAALASGCGNSDGAGKRTTRVVVSAASSLTEALTACQDGVAGVDPKLSFAGSDQLAGQIRQGVRPDVYLAANTKLPDQLSKEGLLQTPIAFASNDLVLAVPADSKIDAIEDLTKEGVTVVLGSREVPFGSYTRELLARLPAPEKEALLANVRSEEPDVRNAVGKLLQGAADASFTYNTDVTATAGKLKAITLPDRLRPTVAYGAAVVKGAANPAGARAYLDSVTAGACQQALLDAGFGAPPTP